MLLQNFPADCDYHCVPDNLLRRMAGLSMHVAQVGAALAVLLAAGVQTGQATVPASGPTAPLPLCRLIKCSTVEPLTRFLPRLDTRKRKSSGSGSLSASASCSETEFQVAYPEDIQLARLNIRQLPVPVPSSGPHPLVVGCTGLGNPAVNAVDLTVDALQILHRLHSEGQSQSWAEQVAATVQEFSEPVVLLGLHDCNHPAGEGVAEAVTVTAASVQYKKQCVKLMGLLSQLLDPMLAPGCSASASASAWTCTGIKIQRSSQQAGLFKGPTGSRSSDAAENRAVRHFLFSWRSSVSPSLDPQSTAPVAPFGPVPVQSRDLWCEESSGATVAIGPLQATFIKLPKGRRHTRWIPLHSFTVLFTAVSTGSCLSGQACFVYMSGGSVLMSTTVWSGHPTQ